MLDYVRNAPAPANFGSDPQFQRHHIHNSKQQFGRPECWVDPASNVTLPCGDYFMESNITAATYKYYINREYNYRMSCGTDKYNEAPGFVVTQQRLKPQYLAGDKRVSYASPKYPFEPQRNTAQELKRAFSALWMLCCTHVAALCVLCFSWLESVSLFPHIYTGSVDISNKYTSQSDIGVKRT